MSRFTKEGSTLPRESSYALSLLLAGLLIAVICSVQAQVKELPAKPPMDDCTAALQHANELDAKASQSIRTGESLPMRAMMEECLLLRERCLGLTNPLTLRALRTFYAACGPLDPPGTHVT